MSELRGLDVLTHTAWIGIPILDIIAQNQTDIHPILNDIRMGMVSAPKPLGWRLKAMQEEDGRVVGYGLVKARTKRHPERIDPRSIEPFVPDVVALFRKLGIRGEVDIHFSTSIVTPV